MKKEISFLKELEILKKGHDFAEKELIKKKLQKDLTIKKRKEKKDLIITKDKI